MELEASHEQHAFLESSGVFGDHCVPRRLSA